MKSIVCEMCGSNEVLKQDGVYVCQYCGTKVFVEEARKMMKGLYELARNALVDCDYETALNSYSAIIQEEPSSWEGLFFSSYCRGMISKSRDIDRVIISFGKVANRAIQLVFANETEIEQCESAIEQIAENSVSLGKILFTAALNMLPGPAIQQKADRETLFIRHKGIYDFLMSEGYSILKEPNITKKIELSGVKMLKESINTYYQAYKPKSFDPSRVCHFIA